MFFGGILRVSCIDLSVQPAFHKHHQRVLSSCCVYFRRHVVRSPFESSSLEFLKSPRLIPLPSDLSLLRSLRFPTRNDKEKISTSYANEIPNDCLLLNSRAQKLHMRNSYLSFVLLRELAATMLPMHLISYDTRMTHYIKTIAPSI